MDMLALVGILLAVLTLLLGDNIAARLWSLINRASPASKAKLRIREGPGYYISTGRRTPPPSDLYSFLGFFFSSPKAKFVEQLGQPSTVIRGEDGKTTSYWTSLLGHLPLTLSVSFDDHDLATAVSLHMTDAGESGLKIAVPGAVLGIDTFADVQSKLKGRGQLFEDKTDGSTSYILAFEYAGEGMSTLLASHAVNWSLPGARPTAVDREFLSRRIECLVLRA